MDLNNLQGAPRAHRTHDDLQGIFDPSTYTPIDLERMCYYDEEQRAIILHATNYDYVIDLDRIDNPAKLLGWIMHLDGKQWTHDNPGLTRRLIEVAAAVSPSWIFVRWP